MAKKKHKLRDAFKKFGDKLKHPFEVLMDVALAPGKLAVFAPLLPFIGVMQGYLKKHNVKVPGSKLDYPENLARQFYQVAILKQPPLTKGVGLADRHKHLENADGDDTVADTIVDKAADGVSKAGLIGSAAGAAIKIIHGIINFIKGMKKKANADKLGKTATVAPHDNHDDAKVTDSTVLTPSEAAAVGNHETDHDLVKHSDAVQDALVAGGVGNVNSKGHAVDNVDDYGVGLFGAIRRLFHHHPHHAAAVQMLEALEG